MTPFNFLQFLTFSALLALLVPLRPIAEACVQQRLVFSTPHGFFAPAYYLFLLCIVAAASFRALFNIVPDHTPWKMLRSLKVHLTLAVLLTAAAASAVLFGIGPDAVRFALVSICSGALIHTAAIPLGFRSPWARNEDEVVNVPLVDRTTNANAFLSALGLLVITLLLLLSGGDTIETIRNVFRQVEAIRST